ncbi:hypothetical protein C8R45DRAFT_957881 [Mycena sanguinolenta]|nr:hypothetical protein C8R45DRAFT_957881 [Mycena sanguinolenta]
MDDSPPPAYSREYSRPLVNSLPLAAAHNPDGTETSRNASKRAEGRDTLPRPLPRLPVGETSSLKTGAVSPLRLHKKSQSTVFPSIERPWKPPSLNDGLRSNNGWNPTAPNPPQFREFVQSPPSQYSRSPPPTPNSWEHGRKADHIPLSFPNRGRDSSLPPTQTPAVDPNAFSTALLYLATYLDHPYLIHPGVRHSKSQLLHPITLRGATFGGLEVLLSVWFGIMALSLCCQRRACVLYSSIFSNEGVVASVYF